MARMRIQGGWGCLAAGLLLIALVWLVALPHLAQYPRIRQRVRFLQQHGIEPAALFYTDLPHMTLWESRVRTSIGNRSRLAPPRDGERVHRNGDSGKLDMAHTARVCDSP